MSNTHIHIVTHDVPYPANIGGLVDMFNKLVWFHRKGIKIHLHCFAKKIQPIAELEKYCETVHYYKRKRIQFPQINLPHIVGTRTSKALLNKLQQDDYPILFESVHSTYYLHKNKFKNRKTFVRLLNTEAIYYKKLKQLEPNIFKKIYFGLEAILLGVYEKGIANKSHFIALSKSDVTYYKNLYGAKLINFIPALLPYNTLKANTGIGLYCLYHANLSVNENEVAAFWLIEKVFSTLTYPLIIAGKNPSAKLISLAKKYNNISIVDTPSETNMQLLIENAQINILPSFNNTGIKLKLLNAIFNGRFCLVNDAGVAGSELDELCIIANNETQFIQEIEKLMLQPFTQKEMQHRSTALKILYNNEQNADAFITMLTQ